MRGRKVEYEQYRLGMNKYLLSLKVKTKLLII